jgi:hypothetical protein
VDQGADDPVALLAEKMDSCLQAIGAASSCVELRSLSAVQPPVQTTAFKHQSLTTQLETMSKAPLSVQQAIQHLLVWESKQKKYEEVVRLLDQSEREGCAFGKRMTMHVLDYASYEWLLVAPDGTATHPLATCYRLIRSTMNWDGPIRLAVADGSAP